jgi:hypothetical protein
VRQDGAAAGKCGGGITLGVGPQLGDADTRGGGDLAGMADQPALEAWALRLGMELECQGVAANLERLMRADIGGGQVHRTFRQIEDVAMPVQHRQSRQRPHHIPACPGQGKRLPSDLLGGSGIDPRT